MKNSVHNGSHNKSEMTIISLLSLEIVESPSNLEGKLGNSMFWPIKSSFTPRQEYYYLEGWWPKSTSFPVQTRTLWNPQITLPNSRYFQQNSLGHIRNFGQKHDHNSNPIAGLPIYCLLAVEARNGREVFFFFFG